MGIMLFMTPTSFNPALTPHEMLQLGVFGGSYFDGIIPSEFPTEWNTNAKLSLTHNVLINAFKVDSGLTRAEWIQRGWMSKEDPLGWFQWYCRYHTGRRMHDDVRQIKRWINFVRHSTNILNNSGGNITHSPVRRQALLHWAWDPCPDFKTTTTVFDKVQSCLLLIK